jgi:hypothetical protein
MSTGLKATNLSQLGIAQKMASGTKALLAKFYKAESVRTAIMRSGMAIGCLADGVCSTNDLTILTLAAASLLTATCYQSNAQQRYNWLPEKLNLLADGTALLASYDAGWLPITDTDIEMQIRAGISYLSMLTTGILFLPI